jgi:stage II sporulation protein P
VTVVDGEAVAQVMCVVGSDASGASHSGWRRNLALAARLRNALNAEYGNLCRPVYVKKSAYNQQYAPASLLLEIGASGNSQAEAERAAALIAEQIAKLLG